MLLSLTEVEKSTLTEAEARLTKSRTQRERLQRIVANRELYRMKPKGRPSHDGSQRFTYPDGYAPKSTDIGGGHRTITIPALLPEAEQRTNARKTEPLKYTQKFQYKSEEWRGNYGMRSLVESSFNHLKQHNGEDLGEARKRSGRGHAFQYIASTLAVVSSNIRRIISFFEDEAAAVDGGKLKRTKRTKTERSDARNWRPKQSLAPPA